MCVYVLFTLWLSFGIINDNNNNKR